jgi:hypothetical protein
VKGNWTNGSHVLLHPSGLLDEFELLGLESFMVCLTGGCGVGTGGEEEGRRRGGETEGGRAEG